MTKSLTFAALAATLSFAAAPALAQSPAAAGAMPSKTGPMATPLPPVGSTESPDAAATSAPTAAPMPSTGTRTDTAATASAASVSTGMSVKDNTGAIIGEVSAVKAGIATIKMGADVFTVDTNKLAVQDGAATVNATQADIRGMLKKK